MESAARRHSRHASPRCFARLAGFRVGRPCRGSSARHLPPAAPEEDPTETGRGWQLDRRPTPPKGGYGHPTIAQEQHRHPDPVDRAAAHSACATIATPVHLTDRLTGPRRFVFPPPPTWHRGWQRPLTSAAGATCRCGCRPVATPVRLTDSIVRLGLDGSFSHRRRPLRQRPPTPAAGATARRGRRGARCRAASGACAAFWLTSFTARLHCIIAVLPGRTAGQVYSVNTRSRSSVTVSGSSRSPVRSASSNRMSFGSCDRMLSYRITATSTCRHTSSPCHAMPVRLFRCDPDASGPLVLRLPPPRPWRPKSPPAPPVCPRLATRHVARRRDRRRPAVRPQRRGRPAGHRRHTRRRVLLREVPSRRPRDPAPSDLTHPRQARSQPAPQGEPLRERAFSPCCP